MKKEKAGDELSSIKESALIKKITKSFKLSNKSSVLGIGDDAAILNFDHKEIIVSNNGLWSDDADIAVNVSFNV